LGWVFDAPAARLASATPIEVGQSGHKRSTQAISLETKARCLILNTLPGIVEL
jgi:hypothetical protein